MGNGDTSLDNDRLYESWKHGDGVEVAIRIVEGYYDFDKDIPIQDSNYCIEDKKRCFYDSFIIYWSFYLILLLRYTCGTHSVIYPIILFPPPC